MAINLKVNTITIMFLAVDCEPSIQQSTSNRKYTRIIIKMGSE